MDANKLLDLNERLSSLCGMIMEGGVSRLCDKACADYGMDYVLCEYGYAVDDFARNYMLGHKITEKILKNLRRRLSQFVDKYEIEEGSEILELVKDILGPGKTYSYNFSAEYSDARSTEAGDADISFSEEEMERLIDFFGEELDGEYSDLTLTPFDLMDCYEDLYDKINEAITYSIDPDYDGSYEMTCDFSFPEELFDDLKKIKNQTD